MYFLKIIAFIGSIIGYFFIFRKLFKIDSFFVPLFTFSTLTLGVYLGGLCHYLLEVSYLLMFIGLGCFIYFLIKHPFKELKKFFNLFHLAFFIGCVLFFVLLLNSQFIHYDNFSHWGTVVKTMLLTNDFPNIQTPIIEFTNYPLGMSSFIYYGCLFLGHGQNIMLFMQGIYIFSCFYAIFGIIQEKKRFLLYTFLAAGCSLLSIFNITIRINNLLVDFVLPIVSLAVFSISYTYRHDLKKAMIALPILGLLTIVKSTGSIFALINLIYIIYLAFIDRDTRKKSNIKWVLPFALSYLPIILWQLHMKTAFAGVSNKFDVSSTQIKTTNDIHKIIQLFIKSSFDFSSRQTLGIFIFEIVTIVATLFLYFFLKKKWALIKALIALDIMLILYYLGILAMYIFSMPLDEALYLAGFERYSASIVVLFCGALIMCATVDLENSFSIKMNDTYNYRAFKSIKTKKYYQMGIIASLSLAIITLLSEYNGMIYNQNQYQTSLVQEVKNVTGDRWNHKTVDSHKYLTYASDKESQVTNYYLQYISRYMLFADHVDGVCLFYEDNLINLLNNYDYLVIVEADKNEKDLLKRYFNVDGKEGIYRVKDLFSNMTPLAKKQYELVKKYSQ
ncbi:MAG: hypothetical protein Q4Q31_01030 [Bacillota bacterium]|nr:hypothetical protein [Bacillota bacterium]